SRNRSIGLRTRAAHGFADDVLGIGWIDVRRASAIGQPFAVDQVVEHQHGGLSTVTSCLQPASGNRGLSSVGLAPSSKILRRLLVGCGIEAEDRATLEPLLRNKI